jgi:methyl-accepting chemotaxis protein
MFQRLTSAAKILGAFAAAFVLVLVLGAVTFVTARSLKGRIEDLGAEKLVAVETVGVIMEAQAAVAGALNLVVMQQATPMMRREGAEQITTELKRLAEQMAAYEAMPRSPEAQKAWEEAGGYLKSWRFSAERVAPLVEQRAALGSGDGVQAQSLDAQIWDAYLGARSTSRSAEEALDAVSAQVRKEADASRAAGQSAASTAVATLVVVLLLVAGLMGLLGWIAARQIGAAVTALVGQAGALREAVAQGRLDARGDPAVLAPEFRPIVQGVNEMMDAFVAPIRMTAGNLDRLSRGDLPPQVTEEYRGDFNVIKDSLNRSVGAVEGLVGEIGRVAAAHDAGDLDAKVDAAAFQGAYAQVAQGLNGMVGGHVAMNRKAMGVFADFGRGNIDATMEQLPGQKRFVNDTIEQVRGNLKGLIAEMNLMSAEHDAGDIDAVVDAGRFEGAYRTMAEGINGMVGGHIAMNRKAMAVFAEFGRGNFAAELEALPGKKRFVNEAVEQVRGNLQALVADAAALARAAVEGRLSTRADAARHQGDFRRIVEGVNATLDAVIAPVNEATQVLERLAARDLRTRMAGAYQGDHARIKDAVNRTAEALDEALVQVAAAVEQVSGAASQIASSSQAVASGASEQASSLEQTSTSVDAVAGMARQTADNAHQANGMAGQARDAATAGAASVEQMTATMNRIRASAEGTSQIIKDINEIAFQTNLLALNAAVEAARAGEAGRGFAVVAEEVRSLALRSKEAATKTEELIRQSVKETGEGEVACKHLGERLGEIVGAVGKVTAIVGEITAAAREQSAGIEQVTHAVSEMDKVTQQNAASAEQSSSAASELSGQSQELAAMIAGFQLTRSGAAPGKRARAPAPAPAAALAAPARARAAPVRAAPVPPARAAAKPDHDQLFPMEADPEVRDF